VRGARPTACGERDAGGDSAKSGDPSPDCDAGTETQPRGVATVGVTEPRRGADFHGAAHAAAEAGRGLPRIAMLENEYQRAVLAAEARWVTETISQLRSGQLTWSPDELLAFASRE